MASLLSRERLPSEVTIFEPRTTLNVTNHSECSLTKLEPLARAALMAPKACSSDGGLERQVRPVFLVSYTQILSEGFCMPILTHKPIAHWADLLSYDFRHGACLALVIVL